MSLNATDAFAIRSQNQSLRNTIENYLNYHKIQAYNEQQGEANCHIRKQYKKYLDQIRHVQQRQPERHVSVPKRGSSDLWNSKRLIEEYNIIKGIEFYEKVVQGMLAKRKPRNVKMRQLLKNRTTYCSEPMNKHHFVNSIENLERRLGELRLIKQEDRLNFSRISKQIEGLQRHSNYR